MPLSKYALQGNQGFFLRALGPPNMLLLATSLVDDYRMDGRSSSGACGNKILSFYNSCRLCRRWARGRRRGVLPPAPSQWFPDSLCAKVKPLSLLLLIYILGIDV